MNYSPRLRHGEIKSIIEYVDTDAYKFLLISGITDGLTVGAIDTLVKDLKRYNIWTKMLAIYPFVGGTGTLHRLNLRTVEYFNLIFTGTWTHASTGSLPTNSYATTGFIPYDIFPSIADGMHISYYSRTNANTAADQVDMGSSSGTNFLWLSTQYNASGFVNRFLSRNSISSILADSANADARGHYISSKRSNTASNFETYKNGTSQNTQTGGGNEPTNQIYIGALNSAGSPAFYTNRECAFASIGSGLDDTQAADFYTCVQDFQTRLSRQV